MKARWVAGLLVACAALLPLCVACKRAPAPASANASGSAAPVVKADTGGLLLTWIDDKGDFHVETRVPDVPAAGQDVVRVVDGTHEPSSPDDVFVADLRQAGPADAYPVRAMPRAEFEAIAVTRRAKAGPTLASAAPRASSAPESSGEGAGAAPNEVVVVIYGAEWCSACHDAARYMRKMGIPYVEKDIEKDPGAEREMEQKLAKNHLRGGSIPVIDVRGTIMVGFDPGRIDAALHTTAL